MPYSSDAYVNAALSYLRPPREKPFNLMYDPPPGVQASNCEYQQVSSRIRNGRQVAASLSLQENGFTLLREPSSLTDFLDANEVAGRYYREMEAIALALTDGRRAVCFDHAVRKREPGRPPLGFGRSGDGSKPAALGRVHNDYTEESGRRRLDLVFPEGAPDAPFLILNLWRPIHHPAIDTPLAVCDARSFPARDWVATDIIYQNRVGEIYLGMHSSGHQWYYFPEMQPDEVLAFVTYDSRFDQPARMTPHCAFDDPNTPADAPLRQSIEARCLVVLD